MSAVGRVKKSNLGGRAIARAGDWTSAFCARDSCFRKGRQFQLQRGDNGEKELEKRWDLPLAIDQSPRARLNPRPCAAMCTAFIVAHGATHCNTPVMYKTKYHPQPNAVWYSLPISFARGIHDRLRRVYLEVLEYQLRSQISGIPLFLSLKVFMSPFRGSDSEDAASLEKRNTWGEIYEDNTRTPLIFLIFFFQNIN